MMSDVWKKLKSLGEGDQGHAYLVERADGTDKCQYVLKRLKNLERDGRFEAEIAALSKLLHPNIVQIFDHGEEKGKPFFVMEFCEGGDLTALHLAPLCLRDRLGVVSAGLFGNGGRPPKRTASPGSQA